MKARMPEADRHGRRGERRERRGERADAGGDRDRDGERVVDDERGAGDEARVRAEVRARHGVGPAATGVRVDDLAVGEDEDREQRDDGERDRQHEVQRARTGEGQHDDDRLGPVGDRGQRVERQRREPLDGVICSFDASLERSGRPISTFQAERPAPPISSTDPGASLRHRRARRRRRAVGGRAATSRPVHSQPTSSRERASARRAGTGVPTSVQRACGATGGRPRPLPGAEPERVVHERGRREGEALGVAERLGLRRPDEGRGVVHEQVARPSCRASRPCGRGSSRGWGRRRRGPLRSTRRARPPTGRGSGGGPCATSPGSGRRT